MLKNKVDLVVVIARNRSVRTFASMALGYSYQLYSYLLYVNDAHCGKSFITSPTKGLRKLEWVEPRPGSELGYVRLMLDDLRRRSGKFLKKLSYDENAREENAT